MEYQPGSFAERCRTNSCGNDPRRPAGTEKVTAKCKSPGDNGTRLRRADATYGGRDSRRRLVFPGTDFAAYAQIALSREACAARRADRNKKSERRDHCR